MTTARPRTGAHPSARPAAGDDVAEHSCRVDHEPGLHVRAASVFVKTAQRFRATVTVEAGGARADGKSIMELLTLAAARGSTLRIFAEGPDAARAVRALAALVARGFDEDMT